MKKVLTLVVTIALCCAAMAFAAGCSNSKGLFEEKCSTCHATTDVNKLAYDDSSQWLPVVERMNTYGAELTDSQISEIADYLASEFAA